MRQKTSVFTMRVTLSQLIVLLTAVMTLGVSGQGCTVGWFGENCAFKCHCGNSATCEKGECPKNQPCETGYFGAGCEYWDVLHSQNSRASDRYLLDLDDITCNSNMDATSVYLPLSTSFPFSWLRIHVKDSEQMLNFTTTLNGWTECPRERKFIVDKTIVDVTCDTDMLVQKIRIDGPVAPSICSIYMDGGCSRGWFGEDCKLKCHCRNSETCYKNGECPYDKPCKIGFFGPGCQYWDVLESDASTSTERYLLDYDDSTCNPQKNATFVELSLKRSLHLSWFRIHVNDSDQLINFTTTLNTRKACTSERKFIINKKIVDVTCDVDFLVNKIRIEGPVAPSICTVYVNGGRNVALKQTAIQSTTSTLLITEFSQDSNAVDGDTNPHLQDKHCTQTKFAAEIQWWRVAYSRPQILYLIRVYNRDSGQEKLRGFTLETFNEDEKKTSSIKDPSTSSWDTYDVISTTRVPVTKLTISQFSESVTVLILCEVETYGDTVCPKGTYGLFCSGTCSCAADERCSSITGECSQECKPGFYGFNCSSRCSETCLNHVCRYHSGHCLWCPIDYYTGITCKKKCRDGWYGENCTQMCPRICTYGTCVTGADAMPVCKGCAAAFYGPNCTNKCPVHCAKGLCRKRTGQCLACVEGYRGEFCVYESAPSVLIFVPLCVFFTLVYFCSRRKDDDDAEGI